MLRYACMRVCLLLDFGIDSNSPHCLSLSAAAAVVAGSCCACCWQLLKAGTLVTEASCQQQRPRVSNIGLVSATEASCQQQRPRVSNGGLVLVTEASC
jgi:hypothetical protein